jgi:hypothetical protein
VKRKEQCFEAEGESWKPDVQLALPAYLDAGEYEILMRRYEIAGLKEPQSLRSIRGEGTMAYVMAKQRLGLKYTADETRSALHAFLKRNLDSWLDSGHSNAAAQWMKIAFWQPGDDPLVTFLRCYDYLPGVERPKYPQLSAAAQP